MLSRGHVTAGILSLGQAIAGMGSLRRVKARR
jgi:hypothetical protein